MRAEQVERGRILAEQIYCYVMLHGGEGNPLKGISMAWFGRVAAEFTAQKLEALAASPTPAAKDEQCTHDPNTCKVGFCDWPRCNSEAAASQLERCPTCQSAQRNMRYEVRTQNAGLVRWVECPDPWHTPPSAAPVLMQQHTCPKCQHSFADEVRLGDVPTIKK